MTGPEHLDGDPWLPIEPGPTDPGDPEYGDYDPAEWFPPGATLDELAAWGWYRLRDLHPRGDVL